MLAADTVGLGRTFTQSELELVQQLSLTMAEALDRVEYTYAERNAKCATELEEAYKESRPLLEEELEAAKAAEAEEGGDVLATSRAKHQRATALLGSLEQDKLEYLQSRRTMKPELLAVLKAVLVLLAEPEQREAVLAMDWPQLKGECIEGRLPWGTDLFAKVASYNVEESQVCLWGSAFHCIRSPVTLPSIWPPPSP